MLTFFKTLCEEQDVRTALRTGAVGLRSASLIAVMLRSLYGEESADYTVADPLAWGLDKVGKFVCTIYHMHVCIWKVMTTLKI